MLSNIADEGGTFVYVEDPDGLTAELAGNGAAFSVPLKDTSDGLRGFEISDPDGYDLAT